MNVNSVLIGRLAGELQRRKAHVAVAESCTGGWVAKTLTDRPGSSAWFEYGFVTYSNRAKVELLGVAQSDIDTHGAVSEVVARAMAEGAASRAGAEFSIAVTGIAGPDGGSASKPVGTVWFGWHAVGMGTRTERMEFAGDRDTVRRQTVTRSLAGLLDMLEHHAADH